VDISVIIVNYQTADLVSTCIDSVLNQTGIHFEIIVVDNASQDHSLTVLENYAQKITLIKNSSNVGFGRANNLAATRAEGRYIFLLNPDAVLKTRNDLKEMMRFMEEHPHIGLAGTEVLKGDKNKLSAPSTFYPGEKIFKKKFAHLPGNIAWVIGASMMIRREIYTALNGFDEDYFLYGEETDLCLRVRQHGAEIGYNPNVSVAHIGGASEQRSSTEQLWRRKQNGLHLFYQKTYAPHETLKLVKKNLLRAKLRLMMLTLKKCLNLWKKTDLVKYDRYKTVCITSKQFLTEHSRASF
jgi:N-acetylglucosaminyl-diphospho-decaprenol L-rhamnosyltransferase